MPANRDGTFDSSRKLAYGQYLVRYFQLLEKLNGIADGQKFRPQALRAMMDLVEKTIPDPDEKIDGRDVIIAACDVAFRIARLTGLSPVEFTREIVRRWDPMAPMPSSQRVSSALEQHGFVLPSRINRNRSGGRYRN